MTRTAATILREIEQAKRAQLKPTLQAKIISELEAELARMYGEPDPRQTELQLSPQKQTPKHAG